MITHSKFWPLDFDQEYEIYDSPSWNLPGRRKKLGHTGRRKQASWGTSEAKILKA